MAKKTPKSSKKKSSAVKRTSSAGRKKASARKPAARRTRAARKKKSSKAKAATRKTSSKPTAKKAAGRQGSRTRRTAKKTAPRKAASRSRGLEQTLAQTPEAGRTVKGRTNPMPTRRSTGQPAGAGTTRRAPGLDRARRRLRELEETIETPPSSLDMNRMASAARTGRAEMRQERREHTESSPALTGGDVDADWQDAYAVGDEAPGGDNPTPDQDRVDDIGKALGVVYEDNEELKASDKIAERDKHRWELDPASSEDYRTRDRDVDEE
jgi:hypothetical protein